MYSFPCVFLPHPHVSPSFLTGLNSPHFILLASSSPQFIVGRRPSSTRAYIYINIATTCRPLYLLTLKKPINRLFLKG